MEVLIFIYTFANRYLVTRGKGRENYQQTNTTMIIKNIRKALVGREVMTYNSFSGVLLSFIIAEVTKSRESIIVKPANGTAKIYIPKGIIEDLLETGYCRENQQYDGCRCFEEWKLEK